MGAEGLERGKSRGRTLLSLAEACGELEMCQCLDDDGVAAARGNSLHLSQEGTIAAVSKSCQFVAVKTHMQQN